ncbi:DGQHR domain-containing protein [Candidatus Poribacteria bacterium]|nr:DGQHR domain-containing protein [Candidatus Poribacteria bacterium]
MAFEDFEPAQEHSSWTDELEFTSSVFEISSIPIRYYLTNVRLSALEECFKLVEDIPESANWGYNAIFQRDIDDDRVENELLRKYLLNANKFKFFNPLTIALLPFDAKENQILDKYPEGSRAEKNGKWQIEHISGIEAQSLSGATIGKIKWERNRIVGVAIDGQHRLSALMQYAKRTPPGIDPSEVRIPIVLLVFDPNRGRILEQIREIFVDINKNVKPVTKARNILLNDRDVFAVLARSLIKDDNNIEGLRYEVVDWKRETARPEGEHQLTTLVVLDEIIRLIFQKRLTVLDSELDLNAELDRKKLETVDTDSSIDNLSDEQIQTALERFRLKHKKFVLYLLENLPPYRAFLDKVAEYLDTPEEASKLLKEYLFKPAKKREEFKNEITRRGFNLKLVIDKPLQALKESKGSPQGADLLFFSIGQRGLFSIFYSLRQIYNLERLMGFQELAEEYCKDLALLIENEFFVRNMKIGNFPIWQGVCMRGDKINASEAAANRLGALVLLAIAAIKLNRVEEIEADSRVKLRKPFSVIQKEYEKEWLARLEESDEQSSDSDEFEEDEPTENDWNDESLTEVAQKKAKDTIYKILKQVQQWAREKSISD